jgi:hypothetical protein
MSGYTDLLSRMSSCRGQGHFYCTVTPHLEADKLCCEELHGTTVQYHGHKYNPLDHNQISKLTPC